MRAAASSSGSRRTTLAHCSWARLDKRPSEPDVTEYRPQPAQSVEYEKPADNVVHGAGGGHQEHRGQRLTGCSPKQACGLTVRRASTGNDRPGKATNGQDKKCRSDGEPHPWFRFSGNPDTHKSMNDESPRAPHQHPAHPPCEYAEGREYDSGAQREGRCEENRIPWRQPQTCGNADPSTFELAGHGPQFPAKAPASCRQAR